MPPPLLSRSDLKSTTPQEDAWVWRGFVGPGLLTLFSSRWKIGKTTLLGMLLAKMGEGGTLAGAPVAKGRVVVSEESRKVWDKRCDRLGIGEGHIHFWLRPFRGQPSVEEWFRFVEELSEIPADLYLLDPLGKLLPANTENQASSVFAMLEPLQRLTERDAAVALLHHPRKGTAKEFSHRGSGALTGLVDVLMELTMPQSASAGDRRRVLRSVSRLDEPIARTIELNEAGTDYAVLAEAPRSDAFELGWPVLKMVLEDAERRTTRESILKDWPRDYDRPCMTVLRGWLERAVAEKLVNRSGSGRRANPFKYALPGKKFDPYGLKLKLPDIDEVMRHEYGNAAVGGVVEERRLR